MATKKTETTEEVSTKRMIIPSITYGQMECTITGDKLVTHRYANKAMHEMLDNQITIKNKTTKIRKPKDPMQDFVDGLYVIEPKTMTVVGEFTLDMVYQMEFGVFIKSKEEGEIELSEGESVPAVRAMGRFGFPAIGFKSALATACAEFHRWKTAVHRNVRIPMELIEIECEGGPVMRMDMVRLRGQSGVTTDLRFRPEFRNWKAKVIIQYNKSTFSDDDILRLVRYAGMSIGLGEWRAEKGGLWGSFQCGYAAKLGDIEL